MKYFLLFVSIFSAFNSLVFSQTNFYAPDTIQKVEITFTQPNWDYMLDTSKLGVDGYIVGSVAINGTLFTNAGVKYKGYSSYDSTKTKNPLHIKLDYIQNNANYQGFEDVKLSNGFSDPSSVREVLSYEILRNYMDAPQSNFSKVYVNGKYYGIYSSSESIDKGFLKKKFYSSGNTFFKCNPANLVSGKIPNLLYHGTDSTNYYPRYEIKSDAGWKDLINLCDTLNNQPTHIDSVLDVDRALWMLAFNNVTVNLDSYTGSFSQNYYLYRDENERFVPVIWDLNMCFGGFPNTGSGTLNIAGMQNMNPVLHSTNGARPLIMNLLANPTYTKMYVAHMRTINKEFFSNGNYLTRAQKLQSVIDTSVKSETFSLYSYSQFQSGLTTNVGTIPGISNLMGTRSTYLNSTAQFQQVPPAITNVNTNPAVISLNDTIWVRCKVSNQTAVMLGYRDQLPNRFRRITMLDDGKHHDAAAGDSIFGIGIIASSALIQYYIYAENANAGIFSPERAEHEFYTVPVVVSLPTVGQIRINEFLANNINGQTDETGKHEDWIELYNTTSSAINLYGLYLTDDYTNPKKFSFPNPTIIPPNGYSMIWADEDPSTTQFVHCNFNLSALGEKIMLGNGAALVLDSISFGSQKADTSIGRCPNGAGPLAQLATVSFNASNCGTGTNDVLMPSAIPLFPNPAEKYVYFSLNENVVINSISVINTMGQTVRNIPYSSAKDAINVADLAKGVYGVLFRQDNKIVHIAKFVKQ